MMRRFVWLLLAAAVWLPGCGGSSLPKDMPNLLPVRVAVTHNGSPVSGAVVMFQPAGGEWHASGISDANGLAVMRTLGQYDGVVPGEYAVKINKNEAFETGETELDDDGNPVPVVNTKNVLPAKYASFDKSDLKISVSKDTKDVKFDLTE